MFYILQHVLYKQCELAARIFNTQKNIWINPNNIWLNRMKNLFIIKLSKVLNNSTKDDFFGCDLIE